MTKKEIADIVFERKKIAGYDGQASEYAVSSVISAEANYPTSKLIIICNDMGLSVSIEDMNTGDIYQISSQNELYRVVSSLMYQYNLTTTELYAKAGVYFYPMSIAEEDKEKQRANISIDTLLSVLDALHCGLLLSK